MADTAKTLARLANLIESRFQKQIMFSSLQTLADSHDVEMLLLVRRNQKARFIVNQNNLVIPVRVNDQVLGALSVLDGLGLNPEEVEYLIGVVDLILGSLLTQLSQLDLQNRLEKFLVDRLLEESENTETLERTPSEVPPSLAELAYFSVRDFGKTSTPLFLRSDNMSLPTREIAFEIHSFSSRSAFISWEHLDAAEIQSLDDLKVMGSITLFVPDLGAISEKSRTVLENYISKFPCPEFYPRIIASSKTELSPAVSDKFVMVEIPSLDSNESIRSKNLSANFSANLKTPADKKPHLFIVPSESN